MRLQRRLTQFVHQSLADQRHSLAVATVAAIADTGRSNSSGNCEEIAPRLAERSEAQKSTLATEIA